ncbi:hypothetical protein BDY24DRAFT_412136 [Mrakia frigida]|uniref:uncharacterized protein n=1 Tax=Mrakia frigida TaxID=29902 RepID=UPI003FCC2133
MAPNDDLPSKRARNPPPPPPSAAPPPPRVKRKRPAAEADDEPAGGRKAGKDNSGGKLVASASMGGGGGSGAGTPTANGSVAPGGSGAPGEEPKRESKLDFVAFPAEALQSYLLYANLVPNIEPSPYSDLPAPLPNTLYAHPSSDESSFLKKKKPRVAILADVQAAHEVFAAAAKEHWEKTGGAGSGGIREGEVVTGFLYRCRVGDRVLKVVPPS